MFDLNDQIRRWRENLVQSQTLGAPDIDELESHLREDIESLKQTMLSTEEAFLVATHRLGSPAGLACEFAKVNRSLILRQRLAWMIAGILAYLLATQFIASAGNACVWLASIKGARGHGLGVVALACNVAILAVAVCLCCFLWRRSLQSTPFRKWTRQLRARLILPIALLVLLGIGSATRIALSLVAFRVLDPAQGVQTAQILAWTRLAWSIMLPVILVIVLIKLGTASEREVEAE